MSQLPQAGDALGVARSKPTFETATVTGALTAGSIVNGGATTNTGTVTNSGSVINSSNVYNRASINLRNQGAPQTATDTATITAAQLIGGILAATPTAAANYTLPTGTLMLAALPATIAANDSFDVSVINLAGTTNFDITFLAGTDFTIVGNAVVRPGVDSATEQAGQAIFRIRYVTGVTFIAYRIA